MNNLIKLFDIPQTIIKDNERQRRVYSINGISPGLLARSDSPKVFIVDDLYANREPRVYIDYSPSLRSERSGLKVVRKI